MRFFIGTYDIFGIKQIANFEALSIQKLFINFEENGRCDIKNITDQIFQNYITI